MNTVHLKTEFLNQDWIALALTLALIVLHLLVPRLRRLSWLPEAWLTSFGGGFAAAYVFLHLLPGFEENHRSLGAMLSQAQRTSPLYDLTVYFTALLGFVVFLGLERRAQALRAKVDGPSRFDFYLHLSSLLVMNFIITYTMPLRVELGVNFALAFTVMIAFHFLILDRGLEAHFPEYFDGKGRFILVGALLFGWISAALTEPNSVILVILMTSFLTGAVLFGVFRNEMPLNAKSSYGAFIIGAIFGSALIATMNLFI